MDIRTLRKKTVADLREIATVMGFKHLTKYRKDGLIDLIVNGNVDREPTDENAQEALPFTLDYVDDSDDDEDDDSDDDANEERGDDDSDDDADDDDGDVSKASAGETASEAQAPADASKREMRKTVTVKGSEKKEETDEETVEGVLEIIEQGYGFLRFENFLSSERDVYVSPSQIRRFHLRTGDKIFGTIREANPGERFKALYYIKAINGMDTRSTYRRPHFDALTPLYPTERFRLEGALQDKAMRIIDIVSPIGKGQRGLIVAPPKSGKTILLKKIAQSISKNYPDVELIVLLIDERPEEVTDMKRSIDADVIYSTFDELPSHHVKVAEMVLSRAKALVEQNKDVVVLLDSITRLARAYNLVMPPSGRTLSGGLDPSALHRPKRFLGAARNTEEGGSLTVLATALIETGSRMDDVIFEEFKGTGNMELLLDRKLSEKRIFPSVDIRKSGTRREEMLLDDEEREAVWRIRRGLDRYNTIDTTEKFFDTLLSTKTNREFVQIVNRDAVF